VQKMKSIFDARVVANLWQRFGASRAATRRVSADERRRSTRESVMKHGSDDMPIACGLTSAELREREATLLAQFRSAVIETEELQEGYAFRLPGNGEWITLIAELIVAERECCPFLNSISSLNRVRGQ
jgi:hypothetical protein